MNEPAAAVHVLFGYLIVRARGFGEDFCPASSAWEQCLCCATERATLPSNLLKLGACGSRRSVGFEITTSRPPLNEVGLQLLENSMIGGARSSNGVAA
jgi:hypothetical protein